MVEVNPSGALLESDIYIVVEVSEAVVVRTHSNDLKYRDCDCDPNPGLTGHEDLIVALVPDTSNTVVVSDNTRSIETLKINFFVL